MTDYRQRMMTGVILTSVILFTFLILLLGNILGGYFKTERMEDFREKLALTAAGIPMEGGRLQIDQTILREAADALDGEVILYQENGNFIASSASGRADESLRADVMRRVSEAEAMVVEEEGEGIRYLFPIYRTDQFAGLIEVTRQTTVESGNRFIWTVLSLSLAAGLFLLLLVVSRLSNSILNPLNNATATAQELARGNFQARSYEVRFESRGNLNHSINILARNLERMTQRYETQQERLETLIENLGSSLVLIDSKGYVSLVNKAFKETFQIEDEDWEGKLYYKILPFKEIDNLIEEVFLTETRKQRQVLLPIKIERRYFDVTGAPVLGGAEDPKGTVLVFHDITELKKLEQMRKDFVANVSHELRTPVTSLKGFAETLLEGAMENKEISERFLTIIRKESNRLEILIQDLLELSKMEQQGFELNWQRVDLANVLDDVMLLLKSKADEKEINFGYEVSGDCAIEGDSARIRQIFINIISNSLAYTGKGGDVSVLLKEKGDIVSFTVKDNGSGMDKEEIPRIFERFYRVDKARSRNSGGTGLGLAIVKHLVEAHGGRIHVESERQVGTEFSVEFNKQRKQERDT